MSRTCGSLLNILNSVTNSLLCGIEVALLAGLGASGVGEGLGDGFVALCVASVSLRLLPPLLDGP